MSGISSGVDLYFYTEDDLFRLREFFAGRVGHVPYGASYSFGLNAYLRHMAALTVVIPYVKGRLFRMQTSTNYLLSRSRLLPPITTKLLHLRLTYVILYASFTQVF